MEKTREFETSRMMINKQDDAEQATLWEQRILFEISTVMRNKLVHGEQARLFGSNKTMCNTQKMWDKQNYSEQGNQCLISSIMYTNNDW